MANRTLKKYKFQLPHLREFFKMEVDQDEVSLLWVRDDGHMNYKTKCILAEVPKSEVVLLLKEMIEKLEGGENNV